MTERKFWRDLAVYLRPEPLRMLFLGFSSGLPLLLVLGTLSFWLREAGVDLKTIGFLSWVGLIYGFIVQDTGKWPFVLNMCGVVPDEPMPNYYP